MPALNTPTLRKALASMIECNAGIVQILQAAYAVIGAIMYFVQMNLVETVAKAHAASPDAANDVIYVD
jgi:hypothetical protein